MNCADVLRTLETGSVLGRWVARRHIGRCGRCQQEQQLLRKLKRDLIANEHITQAQRETWMAAAHTGTVHVPPRGLAVTPRWTLSGLTVAAIVAVAWGIWWGQHDSAPQVAQQVPPAVNVVSISGETAAHDLAEIRRGLMELSRELEEIAATVKLMDEQQAVDRLLSRYVVNSNSTARSTEHDAEP